MKATRHLYLDLENTVITPVVEGWHNVHLINIPKVKAFIAEFRPDYLNVFSFALHTPGDKLRFNSEVKPRLEDILGMAISEPPLIDDIIRCCSLVQGLSSELVTINELNEFWSKHESFRLYVRHIWKNTYLHGRSVVVALLDDMVINERFEWPDLAISGCLVNIDQLPNNG